MDLDALTGQVAAVSDRYAARHGFVRDDAWYLLKLQEEVGELTQAHLRRTGQARTKGLSAEQVEAGFRAELADVLCHVLLLARHHGVDLAAEVDRKWLVRLSTADGRLPTDGEPAAEGS
ncbi:pyrophosphatase [Spirilliplanes yamanashiensis]|nr:pyrophosphatase [Spirilliplanes yamanashiensis]MDP9814922.1 NTP pyrophosphatase (non-canonical NTP hydrolase) [Spirilliplanes yamanashiensis]